MLQRTKICTFFIEGAVVKNFKPLSGFSWL